VGDRRLTAARRSVRVGDPDGFHARTCAGIARAAQRFRARAVIVHEGREADARSVLELMSLAVLTRTEVELRAEGDDAEACVAALAQLVEHRA
jgi:phosphotransferase system HPr (HPr) family protein